MIRLSILVAALLFAPDAAGQTPTEADGEFRIWNFVSGPVCPDADLADERRQRGQPPSDRICQGNDVPIQGKDGCIWSGEHKRCTWYGFEFDYENADPDIPLVCVWTRSRPGREGDAAGVRSEGLPTGTTEVALKEESGHYFSPGYDLYQAVTFPWGIVRLGYDCSYKGAPAFQTSFRLIYSSAFR